MKEVSINSNGFQLRHTKTDVCTREHNYETRPLQARCFACVLLYIISFEIQL